MDATELVIGDEKSWEIRDKLLDLLQTQGEVVVLAPGAYSYNSLVKAVARARVRSTRMGFDIVMRTHFKDAEKHPGDCTRLKVIVLAR